MNESNPPFPGEVSETAAGLSHPPGNARTAPSVRKHKAHAIGEVFLGRAMLLALLAERSFEGFRPNTKDGLQ